MTSLSINRQEFLRRVLYADEAFAARVVSGVIEHQPEVEQALLKDHGHNPMNPTEDVVFVVVGAPPYSGKEEFWTAVAESLSGFGLSFGDGNAGWAGEDGYCGPLRPSCFIEMAEAEVAPSDRINGAGLVLYGLMFRVELDTPEEAQAWLGDDYLPGRLYICDRELCGSIATYAELVSLRGTKSGKVARIVAALAGVCVLAGITGSLIWFKGLSHNLIYLSFAGLLLPVFLGAVKQEDMTCPACRKSQMVSASSSRGQYLVKSRG